MAAKQGLTAHLSQAGEDAKRAVLSRTSYGTSSWFSNLNTVCTIKSAPPKTPAVLEMLATKSGWIFKRNEQHVWQARWCCVVPHMFLYYFDAGAVGSGPPDVGGFGYHSGAGAMSYGGGGAGIPCGPTPQQQEEWNNALQKNGFKAHEKRGFSLFNENTSSSAATHPTNSDPMSSQHNNTQTPSNLTNPYHHSSSSMPNPSSQAAAAAASSTPAASKYQQPAGIIDLECYTCLHRSYVNGSTILELAGDDAVNPDLRAFYFCVDSQTSDDWTDAFLNGRHAALVDEVEAYKQVADGFACQLQNLHTECDELKETNESLREELYHVRCSHEETRRRCWTSTVEILESPQPQSPQGTTSADKNNSSSSNGQIQLLRSQVKDTLAVDASIPSCLQVLQSYICSLEDSVRQLHQENTVLKQQMTKTGESDQQRVQDLQQELEELRQSSKVQLAQLQQTLESATQGHEQTKKELQDTQKELASTKLEFTMYSSQQKNKLQTLNSHKRILKKEVVQLRQIVEDCKSELQALQHSQESNKLASLQHEQRAALLERYVSQIETQLKCQQNMMEIMSITAASGSVYGGVGGGSASLAGGGPGSGAGDFESGGGAAISLQQQPQASPLNHPHRHAISSSSSLPPLKRNVPPMSPRVISPRVVVVKKKDVSLKEDQQHQGGDDNDDDDDDEEDQENEEERHATGEFMPLTFRRGNSSLRDRDVDADNKSHMSELTEDRTQRVLDGTWASSPRQYHQPLLSSTPPTYVVEKKMSKLSVAQRSRIEADRQTTPVRVRLDGGILSGITPAVATPIKQQQQQQQQQPSPPVSSSSLPPASGMWKRMEEVVLGPAGAVAVNRRQKQNEQSHHNMQQDHRRHHSSSDDSSSSCSSASEEEKKKDNISTSNSKSNNSPSTTANLTLAQRQQLQRAMQLQFLKEQGLISREEDVKGGAGGGTPSTSMSVGSPARTKNLYQHEHRIAENSSSSNSNSASTPHSSASPAIGR